MDSYQGNGSKVWSVRDGFWCLKVKWRCGILVGVPEVVTIVAIPSLALCLTACASHKDMGAKVVRR